MRTISFTSLLSNDLVGPPNESSQGLSVAGVANALGGTASIIGTDVVFTPTANYAGPVGFDYTVQETVPATASPPS